MEGTVKHSYLGVSPLILTVFIFLAERVSYSQRIKTDDEIGTL
jgi:hypothetical protein